MEVAAKKSYKIKYSGEKGNIRYLYECNQCGSAQDEWHSIRDNPVVMCNVCSSSDTFRVISSCRFHLKGAGFPSKEFKIQDEIDNQDAIMREGWQSESEIETAKAMLAERETRLVKEGRKTLSSIREKEVVSEKVVVAPKQFEQVEKQIAQSTNKVEKMLLKKQQARMASSNGTIIKRERPKKVGKEALKKAANHQRKMIEGK